MKFACIDFETANRRRSSACELGVVILESGQILHSRSWLIRPEPFQFEPINVQIHRISADVVRSASTFYDLWQEIRDFIGDSVLVAHSAGFDISVLRSTLELYGLQPPAWRYFCTVNVTRSVWRLPSAKLPEVAASLGLSHTHHEALSDALTCANILLKAVEHTGSGSVEQLLQKHGIAMQVLSTIRNQDVASVGF